MNVDTVRDEITVGARASLAAAGLKAERCHWISGDAPDDPQRVLAKIRYRPPGVLAEVFAHGERAVVRFDSPQSAVAPGQAVVFYDDDEVVGGGWIESALGEERKALHP